MSIWQDYSDGVLSHAHAEPTVSSPQFPDVLVSEVIDALQMLQLVRLHLRRVTWAVQTICTATRA